MNAETTARIPILLVDDRQENLLALEELLRDDRYQLMKATSGNEALRLTLRQDFALALLDVQMPEMDGFEVAELMRANPKTSRVPIIFVTAGMKDLQFQFKGYDVGAVDYLLKPIEPRFLQSKVRIFTELYLQRLELERHRLHLEAMVEERTAELKTANERLVRQNNEMAAVQEQLRIQIQQYEASQMRLDNANRNLQTLFQITPLAIVVSSLQDGTVRELNQTFSDRFGYQREAVIGSGGNEIGLWTNDDERLRFWRLVREQTSVSGFETEFSTAAGEKRDVLLYSNLFEYAGEHCLLYVALDVTEQKRMEAIVRQTQKMEVIGQLASGVAHDFNNMLSAIVGAAEMMQLTSKYDPKAGHLLATILQAAQRSADLAHQLLIFGRKGAVVEVPVAAHEVIAASVSILEHTIDKGIRLITALDARHASIIGDPTMLQNALMNLGVNARDAMPDGGTIAFSTANVALESGHRGLVEFQAAPGAYLEIAVTDSGTGMSEETQRHIFEPFFTTKEVGKGTGLGLAAVYATVRQHHGCIVVESEPGVGTTFRMYLPLADDYAIESRCQGDEEPHGSGGILLVDDERLIQESYGLLLDAAGYTVYAAENGLRALELYEREKEQIALVLLDVIMPGMGGKETLRRLREINPGVKVLIVSGAASERLQRELEALGIDGFLRKPFHRAELFRAVANAIGCGGSSSGQG